MSKATICDKCRKILRWVPSVRIAIDFPYNGTAKYELCEDCKEKLLVWLSGEDLRKANFDYEENYDDT
jgi:RNase P subunit RPR2